MVSRAQAKSLADNLPKFQTEYGICATAVDQPGQEDGQQWTAPNTWAPLVMLTADALSRYGYDLLAEKVAHNFVSLVNNHFMEDGHDHVLEKYNAVNPAEPPKSAVYPDQVGFGWTNSVVAYLINRYKL